MTTAARQFISTQYDRWDSGDISKYEFYGSTMNHSAKLVAEISGIDIEVIKDRRRYLKQLAADDAKRAEQANQIVTALTTVHLSSFTRLDEIVAYAKANDMNLQEAVRALVNAALSHGLDRANA